MSDSAARTQPPHDPVLPIEGLGPLFPTANGPDHPALAIINRAERLAIAAAAGTMQPLEAGAPAVEERRPRGLALLAGDTASGTRVFVCDTWHHRVQALDGEGHPLFAFGGHGSHEGQFDTPSDVTIVRPQFAGEPFDVNGSDVLLAVADTGNGRVQVFELDGAFVASFGTPEPPADGSEPGFTREGWPFFRTGTHPHLPSPARLTWRPPHLDVTCAEGRIVRVDLSVALLPDFARWRHDAAVPSLRAARTALARVATPELPPRALAQIETDLGRAWLARGLTSSVVRLWARPWPAGLDGVALEHALEERLHIAAVHRSRTAREAGAIDDRVLLLLHTLGQRLMDLRRARGRAVSVRELAWQRAQSGEHASPARINRARTAVSEARGRLARATRLTHTAHQLAGNSRTQGHIVWTALPGRGAVQQAAAGRDRIVVASADGRCLFLLDRLGMPAGEVPLPGVARPVAAVPHPQGGWLVADAGEDALLHVDAHGTVLRAWGRRGTGPHDFRGIAGLAITADHVYACDRENGRVQVRDLTGQLLGSIRYLDSPVSVAFDGETLLVSEWRRAQVRRVRRRDGLPVGAFAHPDLVAPSQVVRFATGSVLVADRAMGAVFAFSHDGRWHGTLTAADGLLLGRPAGLVLTDRRNGLVLDEQHGRAIRFALPTQERGWWLR